MVGTGRDRGIPDGDSCAILITAVIPARPEPDGTRPLWASWIGDVSLWISRDGGCTGPPGRTRTGWTGTHCTPSCRSTRTRFEQYRLPAVPG